MAKTEKTEKTEEKRFQSGREVFETYIPGYVPPPPPRSNHTDVPMSKEAGTELATSLLEAFRRHLRLGAHKG